MKYTIIIVLFFISLNCSSQITIDMAGERQNKHYDNGTYYVKDMNNYFEPFLKTWQYIDGNKEFRITITKVTKYHEIDNDYGIDYYIDGLRIQYKKYENGQLVYSSPIEDYPTGISKEFGVLNMSFTDFGRNNEPFPLKLELISNTGPEQGEYKLSFRLNKFEQINSYFQEHPNEPFFSVPNNIVMKEYFLTRPR